MRQYELWQADLPEPAGPGPVLLLSRDSAYSYLNKFLAAEITTRIRGIAQEVRLGRREGLGTPCVANMDNLRTVAKSRLVMRLGAVAHARAPEIKRALGFALGWRELMESA